MLEVLQCGIVFLAVAVDERWREDDLVEQVPAAVVEQRAFAGLQCVPPRVVHVVVAHFRYLALGSQFYGHRAVHRVVVHVAHHNDFDVGVFFNERVFHCLYLLGALFAVERAVEAAGQVVYYDGHVLAAERAADCKEAACLVRAVLGQGLYVWHELDVAHGEHLRVVEQGAVNASFVFAFYVAELIAACGEGRLGNKVGQRLCILHLAHSDGGASNLGQHVGAHLRQHA